MGRGSSKAGGGSGGNKATANLPANETPFAVFYPSTQTPEGHIDNVLITETTDGRYLYKGSFPSPDSIKVDKSSTEYRRAAKDYNIKASFKSDGSVEVQKDGIFSRKKTFKSIDAFEKECNSRIDASIKYHQDSLGRRAKGEMSQIEAINFRTQIARTSSTATSRRAAGNQFAKEMVYQKTQIAAAQDSKAKLAVIVSKAKKTTATTKKKSK